MPDKVRAYRTLKAIDARTARELREVIFEDAVTSEAEAQALESLARDVPDGDPAWRMWHSEALANWTARKSGR